MASTPRYDGIAHFYAAVTGDSLSDPATAGLLSVLPDVAGAAVLDLACGHGRVARELALRGARVTGVDISTELLSLAGAREAAEPLGISYGLVDVTAAGGLDEDRFDGVVCNHALADIDDLDGALAEVARVLKRGGFFAFSLLHPCFPGWGPDAPSSWPPGEGYYHEGWWLAKNPGFRGKAGANHRMLSTYLNALLRHGLSIERVLEPDPAFRTWPSPPADATPVPAFLAALCRRR